MSTRHTIGARGAGGGLNGAKWEWSLGMSMSVHDFDVRFVITIHCVGHIQIGFDASLQIQCVSEL